MIRYFFFVLFFPPAFVILLLVQAHPDDLARYLLAGYVTAALPAAVIAVTDEMLADARDVVRTLCGGLAGLLLTPLAIAAVSGLDVWKAALMAVCGGIAAYLCSVAFVRLSQRQGAVVPATALPA
jgi:hypothetical protein